MTKKNFKITLVAILVFLALVIIGISENFFSLEKKAAVSARRGMDWLLKYDGDLNDPGILWAINEINKDYCSSNPAKSRGDNGASELEDFVFERFGEFENHPVDAAYKKLITGFDGLTTGGSGGEKPSDETIKMSGKKYDSELLDALYCDGTEPKKLQREPENQGFFGYDLTHKFLAIVIAKNNNCAGEREINRQLDATAAQIINEENNSTFDDLFAERVALLEYAGYKESVEKKWIETIIKKQNSSGSWNNSALFGMPNDPHTTALATWALAQYAGACPL